MTVSPFVISNESVAKFDGSQHWNRQPEPQKISVASNQRLYPVPIAKRMNTSSARSRQVSGSGGSCSGRRAVSANGK